MKDGTAHFEEYNGLLRAAYKEKESVIAAAVLFS